MWQRYRRHLFQADELGLTLDISHMSFPDNYLDDMSRAAGRALDAMAALEAGSIANVDEGRMVGHYWLRAADLAPAAQITADIRSAQAAIEAFADDVGQGRIRGAGGVFSNIVHIGIGGSALAPRLLADMHVQCGDQRELHVLDNADPDTVAWLLSRLDGRLDRTLVIVVSKTGSTPTTCRLLSELADAYDRAGVDLARHAVAITAQGSHLDSQAVTQRWLARFALWDWVGGRTSITSAVGLLPAAVLGADIRAFLDGAAVMDRLTRNIEWLDNPAMLLALMWHWAGDGQGRRNMVILPYRDRLAGLPRYLQQLVMESIGKALNRSGQAVHQGLTVYGNRGEPDQHAFVQQLRDGPDDAFVTFIGAHADSAAGEPVAPGIDETLGDRLFANLVGTREALSQRGRQSLTILLDRLDLRSLGALIALYERTVGLYAELIDVNAYHQPGVVTDAATDVLRRQRDVLGCLQEAPLTAAEVAFRVGAPAAAVYDILDHLSRARGRGVDRHPGQDPDDTTFSTGFGRRN